MNIETYKNILKEDVTTKEAAAVLSSVVFTPSCIAERAFLLLNDFIEEYASSDETRQSLVYECNFRPEILTAKLECIVDEIENVCDMLKVCEGFGENYPNITEREEEES